MTPCPEHMLKCTIWNICIPGFKMCDGVVDCPDGSNADEPPGDYCGRLQVILLLLERGICAHLSINMCK